MLTVSLVLLATALALSTVAISIAAYHDARAHDRRIRPQRTTTAAPPHAERPTLRIWQPPSMSTVNDAAVPAVTRSPSAGPDIIVVPGRIASTTDNYRPPSAA
jgi:hypothetical protein